MAAELTLNRPLPGVARRKIVVHRKVEVLDLRSRIRPFVQAAAFLFVLSLTVTAGIVVSSYREFSLLIDQQIAGGYLKSHAGLYAAPRVIEKGARLTKDQLVATLQRAGYARDQASNIWNGSFDIQGNEVHIQPRQGTDSHEWINIKFDNHGYVSNLYANDATDLPSYALEPELLTADAAVKTGQQQTLTFNEIPPVLMQAILAIEDRRFFEHRGVDIWGIGRAVINFTSNGKLHFSQGGSTITQQLVKNAYLTPEKTFERKFNEALIALALENRLSKQDIFALYCNEVYLGQRSGVGVRGVAQAAKVFFGKDLKDLSVDEAATIAGMIQSPARYAPDRHPEAARDRRDRVLTAMVRDGAINAGQEQIAHALPVQAAAFTSAGNEIAPYYVDSVNRALESSNLDTDSDRALRVQTTIDPDLQAAAESALLQQLNALSKISKADARPQGAMVALDPHTGQVLAMVGGRNYAESQLNRATDAKRQPGSVFKPFVYAAALEAGISPLSTFSDTPQTFQYGNATYSPANYGKAYSMHDVTMREGLIRSLNTVTVGLAMRVGLAGVANLAGRFGLPRPDPYPSLALGTTEVTPLQVAAAYAAFVNDGKIVEPTFIAGVMDTSAQKSDDLPARETQVVKPTTAYMITDMLSEVTSRGTARRAKASFKNVAIAGKTGTSRDGWFVGYTPNLVCAVWIGYDDNSQLGLTGAEAALPAWIDFVKEAVAIRPSLGGSAFAKPAGIRTVKIDPETGFLAGPDCPSSVVVSIASQFSPGMDCYKHRPSDPLAIEDASSEVVFNDADVNLDVNTQSSAAEHDQTNQALTTGNSGAQENAEDISSPPIRIRRTQKVVDPRNEPVLVNEPVIVEQKVSAKSGEKPKLNDR
jgi:penicillin-binding protein 1B